MEDDPILGRIQPVKSFCIVSERSSGSNYLESLVKKNLQLSFNFSDCPWLKRVRWSQLSDAREFRAAELRADVLVVGIVRNAVDWAASLFKQPYYAPAHCNVTFAEFLATPWRPLAPIFDDPCHADMRTYCPKTQSSHQEYEQRNGEFAGSVLEMRAWKLQRIRKLCNTRRQAACVRYEDLMADPKNFLDRVRQRFHVDEQPGYFQPVTRYKGSSAPEHASFLPSSEAQLLRAGTPSPLYNATTLALLRRGLDADAEAAAGYTYDDIFSEHGITPSVATAAVHAL